MAALSQQRKVEIAKELHTVATWLHGPRASKVKALALEVEGVEDESESAVVNPAEPTQS